MVAEHVADEGLRASVRLFWRFLTASATARRMPAEQIAQSQPAAIVAAGHTHLVASRERQQQEPGVLERNPHRCVKFEISLVCLAKQGARLEGADPIAGLQTAAGRTHDADGRATLPQHAPSLALRSSAEF